MFTSMKSFRELDDRNWKDSDFRKHLSIEAPAYLASYFFLFLVLFELKVLFSPKREVFRFARRLYYRIM